MSETVGGCERLRVRGHLPAAQSGISETSGSTPEVLPVPRSGAALIGPVRVECDCVIETICRRPEGSPCAQFRFGTASSGTPPSLPT